MSSLEKKTLAEIKGLSISERLEALNSIWESIPEGNRVGEISESEKRILDFSIEHSNKFSEDLIAWEDLKKELHSKILSSR